MFALMCAVGGGACGGVMATLITLSPPTADLWRELCEPRRSSRPPPSPLMALGACFDKALGSGSLDLARTAHPSQYSACPAPPCPCLPCPARTCPCLPYPALACPALARWPDGWPLCVVRARKDFPNWKRSVRGIFPACGGRPPLSCASGHSPPSPTPSYPRQFLPSPGASLAVIIGPCGGPAGPLLVM